MKHYELTYLISSEISEEEIKSLPEKVLVLVQEADGIIENRILPLKRKLAYPINKQEDAYLTTLTFQLNPEKLAGLEKKLKAEGQILRYLLLAKKPTKEVKRVIRKVISEKPVSAQSQEKKVELKEIEKKLEEILAQDDEPK